MRQIAMIIIALLVGAAIGIGAHAAISGRGTRTPVPVEARLPADEAQQGGKPELPKTAPAPEKPKTIDFPKVSLKEPVTGLTADAVAKLGRDQFAEQYRQKAKLKGNEALEAAYAAYAELRRARNEAWLRALPAAQQLLALNARDVLETLGQATEDVKGSGAYEKLFRANAAATAQEALEGVITGLQDPAKKNPTARESVGPAVSKTEAQIKALIAEPAPTPASGTPSDVAVKTARQVGTANLKETLVTLKTLAEALPDEAAARLATSAQELTK